MAKKILVIDDDKDLVTYFVSLLEDNGYSTASAHDGVEGLHKVLSEKPDLIMLDITMPEKSGVRFYRDVRENAQTKDIPVVMVTGVMEEFQQFISSRRQVPPPDAYFSKPVDKNELLKKLEALLKD
ncbi:MAG: response regulator [Pseudomonadota bacterium]